jgi:HD-GYP domain-containing protein (c-di-GMP phosphodiesterase class II)
VVAHARATAKLLRLSEQECREVEQVAMLHDVGKIALPDSVLGKSGYLDADDWAAVRKHPIAGERIVASIPSLARLAPAVRAEHERWDGTGYPDGLAGHAIPMASRIVLVCDAFDAMTSDRPYRRAMSEDVAVEELVRGAGTQFDAAVVGAFVRLVSAR